MDIFDGVEKWISEHGSAQILRDHVNFLREKFSHLERDNTRLKTENETLRMKNAELIGANAALEDMQKGAEVTADEETVLKALVHAYDEISASQLVQITKMSKIRAQHALDELVGKEFVSSSGIDLESDAETTYWLDRAGRAYVVKQGWA